MTDEELRKSLEESRIKPSSNDSKTRRIIAGLNESKYESALSVADVKLNELKIMLKNFETKINFLLNNNLENAAEELAVISKEVSKQIKSIEEFSNRILR